MPRGVYNHEGIIAWNKGKKLSEKHREKAIKTLVHARGKAHYNYKGKKASRSALHYWVILRLGRPRYCECCKRTDRKKYEWSNISGKYKRKLSDWQRLCCSCHRKYDGHQIKMWITRRLNKFKNHE